MKPAVTVTTAAAILLSVAVALAHTGVQNPSVKARMGAMGAIAAEFKKIGEMAKGTRPFDAQTARGAASAIAERSARIGERFEDEADDPKSEAKRAIWDDWDGFTAKAEAMRTAAASAATTIQSPDTLADAFRSIGATCTSCHETYRE